MFTVARPGLAGAGTWTELGKNSAQLELMFGLVELEFRFFSFIFYLVWLMFGLVELEFRLGGLTLFFLIIFYLVWLMLGCIPEIGVVTCLEVP